LSPVFISPNVNERSALCPGFRPFRPELICLESRAILKLPRKRADYTEHLAMKIKYWFVATLTLCLGISAFASGSYNARPPRVPAGQSGDRGKMDNDKYALGKKIYSGKAKLTTQPAADRAAQERRLRELQSRLPARAQENVNLPSMAGQLKPEELEALEYYVTRRYPSK
jgi:hypothetical protein